MLEIAVDSCGPFGTSIHQQVLRKKLHEIKPIGFTRFLAEVDGTQVVFVAEIAGSEEKLLREAKLEGEPLTGQYSAQYHTAHVPDGQDHLHVVCKQNQIFLTETEARMIEAIRREFRTRSPTPFVRRSPSSRFHQAT